MTAAPRPDHWEQPVTVPDVALQWDRIMVGFDGSLVAEQALGYAASFATAGRTEVVVVVAYDPPVAGRRLAGRTLVQVQAALSEEADALATEAVAALHDRGVRARGVVVEGNVTEALLDTAQAEAADLIVLGRSGLSSEVRSSRVAGFLRGWVTQRVALNAPVPVLVVG
jgi:nucleotide-binding universal stress UspA family protein